MPPRAVARPWLAVAALALLAACAPSPPTSPSPPAPPGLLAEPAPSSAGAAPKAAGAEATVAGGPVAPGAFDAEATTYPYPYPVRFFELTSQRQPLRMAYLDVAPEGGGNGRTVLLLHGKNFGAFAWETTIASLVRAGYRVVAPDQIGFGKSSKPERYQYSFAQLAGSTRALLASIGVERSAVVGHSMGGMLAVRYALLHPGATERLVLVNPIGLEDYGAVVPPRTVDDWYAAELAQTPESIRDYQRKAYYDGAWSPAYEAYTVLAAGWTKHPDHPKVAWASALTYDMIMTQPVVHDLPRLRVPTRLVVGLRDRTALGRNLVAPEVAKTMGDFTRLGRAAKRAIPGAELVELPGVGHLPQVEAFAEWEAALLGFLGAPGPARPADAAR